MKTLYTSSPHAHMHSVDTLLFSALRCLYGANWKVCITVGSVLTHPCTVWIRAIVMGWCMCVCGAILSVASRRAPDLSYLPYITSLEENEWDPHSEESRAKCNLGNSLFQSTLMGKGGTRWKRAIEWLNGGSERMVCPALCVPQCVS